MMWNRFGGGGPGWGCYGGRGDALGIILMVVFFIVVVGLVIFGAAMMMKRGHHMRMMAGGHDALDIARERYAKGEISEEEYKKIKENL